VQAMQAEPRVQLIVGSAGRRLVATIIDGALIASLQSFLFRGWPEVPTTTLELMVVIAFFFICPTYLIACTSTTGRTLGKALLGLGVTAQDGSPASFRHAVGRSIHWLLLAAWQSASFALEAGQFRVPAGAEQWLETNSLVLQFAGLGWVIVDGAFLLSNTNRRALHDFLGRTRCVRTRRIEDVDPSRQPAARSTVF